MCKSTVVRTWKYTFAITQLLDSAQSLKLRAVDQIEQEPVTAIVIEDDLSMNRIMYVFWPIFGRHILLGFSLWYPQITPVMVVLKATSAVLILASAGTAAGHTAAAVAVVDYDGAAGRAGGAWPISYMEFMVSATWITPRSSGEAKAGSSAALRSDKAARANTGVLPLRLRSGSG